MRLILTANDGTKFLDIDNPEAYTAEDLGNAVHDAVMQAIDYECTDPNPGHSVKARCYSDDHVSEAEFDASPWFDQATDEEIIALVECDLGGNYPADEVAEFIAERNINVAAVLNYTTNQTDMGFECHVDADEAAAYIAKHRPTVETFLRIR